MPNPKLTPQQAREIYDLAWNSNLKQGEIGKLYNVQDFVVSDIKRGLSYGFYTGARETHSLEELADGHELRPIPGHSGFWITADGRVIYEIAGTFRLSRYGGMDENGYRTIYVDYQKLQLHRVLCLAFKYDTFFPGAVARHLDDDKSNNDLSNLEWGTYKDNYEDSVRNGRRTKKPKRIKRKVERTSEDILKEIDNFWTLIRRWDTVAFQRNTESMRQFLVKQDRLRKKGE